MAKSQPRHQRPINLDKFLFGCPYYPEHWTSADRADDPKRMAAAGVNVVRMAEFAWHRLEPSSGEYEFALFDETIDRLGRAGISTILCTPTATPPRWLTIDHPDWMRVDENGRCMDHGTRQHVCTNNEAFRRESVRITAAMAEHYSDNPHVIGWQTDNELYCHFSRCFCPSCVAGFRQWLWARYGNIERLNAAWGTAFWALTFDSFERIPLPYPNSRPAYPNPTHELDYYRYLSDSVIEFQRQQVQVLRAARPAWFIMHNGMFDIIDYWKFTEDLDFLGVDIYPGFMVHKPEDSVLSAQYAERCRSASGGFIIPEQQGGAGGQKPYLHQTPPPGQMRLWAWQSIAHGADGMMHFRWRTCRFGAETYWNGILDHDNIPRRRYDEFAREGAEIKRLGKTILGTVEHVEAAVLVQTEQNSAYQTMTLGLPSPQDQERLAYRELWRRHLPAGLVQTADSFDGLKLLVLPSLPLMDSDLADKLKAFVHAGGVLMVTARSAIRNRDNQAGSQTPPLYLAELLGATMEEFGKLEPAQASMTLAGANIPSGAGYEVIGLHGAKTLATWNAPADGSPTAYAGQPAITINKVGNGAAIYVGTYMSDVNTAAIMDYVLGQTDIKPLASAADCVEVTAREANGRRLTFVMNHYGQAQKVTGLPKGTDLIADKPCDGELTIGPYDVACISDMVK